MGKVLEKTAAIRKRNAAVTNEMTARWKRSRVAKAARRSAVMVFSARALTSESVEAGAEGTFKVVFELTNTNQTQVDQLIQVSKTKDFTLAVSPTLVWDELLQSAEAAKRVTRLGGATREELLRIVPDVAGVKWDELTNSQIQYLLLAADPGCPWSREQITTVLNLKPSLVTTWESDPDFVAIKTVLRNRASDSMGWLVTQVLFMELNRHLSGEGIIPDAKLRMAGEVANLIKKEVGAIGIAVCGQTPSSDSAQADDFQSLLKKYQIQLKTETEKNAEPSVEETSCVEEPSRPVVNEA